MKKIVPIPENPLTTKVGQRKLGRYENTVYMFNCFFACTFEEVCAWKIFLTISGSSVACQCIWIGKIQSGWTAKFFQAHINAF